jgi:hypothetical protein
MKRSSRSFLKLGLLSLALVIVFAVSASACQNCYTISLPYWPYEGWTCYPALGPGYTGCWHDYYGYYCQTYGDPCEGGGPACFLAGTMISTPDGDRPIESLKKGDTIWCMGEDGKMIAGEVTATLKHVNNGYYRLNGSTLVTGAHRFLMTGSGPNFVASVASMNYEQHALGQWIPLRDLSVGQQLLTIDGTSETIETIEFVDRGVRVFNLEVAPHHNYFANGILVHNRKPDPNQQ